MGKPKQNFFIDKQEELQDAIAQQKIIFHECIEYFFETNNMPKIIGALELLESRDSDNRHNFKRARKEFSELWQLYQVHKADVAELKKYLINN